MPKELRLADVAELFFENDQSFKTTLFQAYSCLSDVQYAVNHFFNKISVDPTVDQNHPFSFLIGDFENLDLWFELLPVSRTPSLGVMMEPEVGYGTKATWA